MPETNTATPLPVPDAGANPNPNLSVAPPPEPAASPRQSGLPREQMEELSFTGEIAGVARRPEYVTLLESAQIAPAFVVTLEQDITAAFQLGQQVVGCDAARTDATQQEAAAAEALIGSLQSIQSAARQTHLPDHPALLENYRVGENLDTSRAVLLALSQNIIDQGNQERPGGIDTGFVTRVQTERAAYVTAGATQSAEASRAKQARVTRDEAVRNILARRRKLQSAADRLWPARQSSSVQARVDFKLPANRPYSY